MSKKLLIAKPIAKELEIFEKAYKESVSSDNSQVEQVIRHVIIKSDGKRIRPILLLLAAKACGEINEATYNSALTVELLHTASLIHDDVVDDSKMRRGQPSLNAIYDNKMSVLVGDYYLSTALIKSVYTGNFEIISSISNIGRFLAEGELQQLFLVKDTIIDENEYFDVIRKKTASLLSVCMKIGAMSVNASEEKVDTFEELGKYLGICFQLRDDIFDYFSNDVGKPTGNDIREGKITLPLLYALKNNTGKSGECLDIIRNKAFTDINVQLLIRFAKDNGGIEYAYRKMDDFKNKALSLIHPMPENDVKQALYQAVDYVIERAY